MSKRFLVCIDSDGCIFDTMEIKHKECFCPSFIDHFGLQAVSKYAREAWEFANLYSATRGCHRLLALRRALTVLADRKEVLERKFQVPTLPALYEYIDGAGVLSNQGLEELFAAHPEKRELRTVLDWSYDVNRRIEKEVHDVPPFPYVKECLEALSEQADIVIVSATPEDALKREWKEHGLYHLLLAVKGQESGSKKEIIAALKKDYDPDCIVMLGDAPGDLAAARANGTQFYPICPDEEAKSWKEFAHVIPAFFDGRYRGETEDGFVSHFLSILPEEPSWEKGEVPHWGRDIGRKFFGDGRVRRYPGNTVVADIIPGCPAYDAMVSFRRMVQSSPLNEYYILTPEDSYHMTVIRGLNDQVRSDDFWPEGLDKTLPMEKVDDYISSAIARAKIPEGVRMKMTEARLGPGAIVIRMEPVGEEAAKTLCDFRNRAADEIGLRLPGHDEYKFHATIGYTRVIPTTEDELAKKEALREAMNAVIGEGIEFVTTKPYMAYYDDMLAFSPERLPR